MKLNMGNTDRTLRLIVGLAVLGVGYVFESYWGLLGLILALTALIGWCPLYAPFNLSTKQENEPPLNHT